MEESLRNQSSHKEQLSNLAKMEKKTKTKTSEKICRDLGTSKQAYFGGELKVGASAQSEFLVLLQLYCEVNYS